MQYPEVLEKWNNKDYAYFTGRDQINKNGATVYDDMEIIYHAVIKFLEYGCAHDMRLVYSKAMGFGFDVDAGMQFRLEFNHQDDEALSKERIYVGSELGTDQITFHTIATYNANDLGFYDYICLEISCDRSSDFENSIRRVVFGNVIYIEFKVPGNYDTCRVGERENKKICFQIFITKVKKYIREHESIYAWLILQGINI